MSCSLGTDSGLWVSPGAGSGPGLRGALRLVSAAEASRALRSLDDARDACTCCYGPNQTVFPLSVFSTVACEFSDYKAGFGGRFGVQSERQDSCAVGFDYKERLAKHESQQGIVAQQPSSPSPPPSAAASSIGFRGSAFRVSHWQGHVAIYFQPDLGLG